MSAPQFLRLREKARRNVEFYLDGQPRTALAGDTILTAILAQEIRLREGEFATTMRSGFCLMGACQDCWVWREDGQRLRGCTTYIERDMRLLTKWPSRTLES